MKNLWVHDLVDFPKKRISERSSKRALILNLREEYDGIDLLERRVPVGSK